MADDAKTEDAATAQAAALKKISTMLAIVIVFQALTAILLVGIFAKTKYIRGDVAKMAVAAEAQSTDRPPD